MASDSSAALGITYIEETSGISASNMFIFTFLKTPPPHTKSDIPVALMQPRVQKVDDFAKAFYFFKEPETYDEAVHKKQWKTDTTDRMTVLLERLRALDSFAESDIEGAVRTLAGELGLSPAKLIHPPRLCLCGVGF